MKLLYENSSREGTEYIMNAKTVCRTCQFCQNPNHGESNQDHQSEDLQLYGIYNQNGKTNGKTTV